MKTAIVYATLHGCTETCARKLATKCSGEVDLFNLKKKPRIDASGYDRILIGGSIHAGRIQASVRRFSENHLPMLLEKRVGLFLCCMEKGEKARQEFELAFPEALRKHASATGLFGGGFDFERMNFILKAIVRKMAKVDHTVSEIDERDIDRFAEEMK